MRLADFHRQASFAYLRKKNGASRLRDVLHAEVVTNIIGEHVIERDDGVVEISTSEFLELVDAVAHGVAVRVHGARL